MFAHQVYEREPALSPRDGLGVRELVSGRGVLRRASHPRPAECETVAGSVPVGLHPAHGQSTEGASQSERSE